LEEGVHYRFCQFCPDYPPTEAQHIGIVMRACQLCRDGFRGMGSPDAGPLVRCDAHADARAAEQNAP
jgi:hypothetical protein